MNEHREVNSDEHTALIGFGSNMGDSCQIILSAWQELNLHKQIQAVTISSPHKSEPMDMASDNWFINAVGVIRTSLAAEDLLCVLLEIEEKLGRVRNPDIHGHQDRTIDLDLLFYDQFVLATKKLQLPHPEIKHRLFVLMPMAEILPEFTHPVYQKKIRQMEQELLKKTSKSTCYRTSWPVASSPI